MSIIIKETEANVSNTISNKSSVGEAQDVDENANIIKTTLLNQFKPYLEVFEYIENMLNILVFYENIDEAELNYVEFFVPSKIININNLIDRLEKHFNIEINHKKTYIVKEEQEYIENYLKLIRKLYSMVNLCSILAIKINDKHDLQKKNDTLSYFEELINDLEKLKEYLESRMHVVPIVEVEEEFKVPMKLKEPYNTYILVFGIPQDGLFEAEKLNIIENCLEVNMTLEQIKSQFPTTI